jgi:hypothetical protein
VSIVLAWSHQSLRGYSSVSVQHCLHHSIRQQTESIGGGFPWAHSYSPQFINVETPAVDILVIVAMPRGGILWCDVGEKRERQTPPTPVHSECLYSGSCTRLCRERCSLDTRSSENHQPNTGGMSRSLRYNNLVEQNISYPPLMSQEYNIESMERGNPSYGGI